MKYICLLCCLIYLSTCKKVEYTEVRAVNGYVETPWGKFEFANIANESLARRFPRIVGAGANSYREVLIADAKGVKK